MRADYAVNAGPIQQLRRPYEVQSKRFPSMNARCPCGGEVEVYDRELGYCLKCGAEYFIRDACSRFKRAPRLQFTGRYTR